MPHGRYVRPKALRLLKRDFPGQGRRLRQYLSGVQGRVRRMHLLQCGKVVNALDSDLIIFIPTRTSHLSCRGPPKGHHTPGRVTVPPMMRSPWRSSASSRRSIPARLSWYIPSAVEVIDMAEAARSTEGC